MGFNPLRPKLLKCSCVFVKGTHFTCSVTVQYSRENHVNASVHYSISSLPIKTVHSSDYTVSNDRVMCVLNETKHESTIITPELAARKI